MTSEPNPDLSDAPPRRSTLRAAACHAAMLVLTAAALEVMLRVADFRDLRVYPEAARHPHRYDPELGWVPIPNKVTAGGIRINSISLRDAELEPAGKPTLLFMGDSFVYGVGVKDDERFTDVLRKDLPGFRVVNAGVAAYGTDQAYLLMRRLWPKVEPDVVVLIVCVENDHDDNSSSSRHGHTFKPYLAQTAGEWKFHQIPVPRPHNWFGERFALARFGFLAYTHIRYPKTIVPDPTTQLVGMMRDYVNERGATFLVGLQKADPALEPFLAEQKIPFVRFDDADIIPGDGHWNSRGHVTVAGRLVELFKAQGLVALDGAPR
jgi:hypothetical protein